MTQDNVVWGLIDPAILEQLKLVAAGLRENPDFSLTRRHRAYSQLSRDAERHSAEIELPHGTNGKKRKALKIAQENLRSAHEYFIRNYEGRLDHSFIKDLHALVGAPGSSEYRDISARSKNTGMIYPRDVPGKMTTFVEENNTLACSAERAIHAHLHIARIHPFADGNGRLARLVQNGILDADRLPPIIVEPYEKGEYITLIDRAARSYNEHRTVTSEQRAFYNYLGLKLHDSIREVRRKLSL